MNKSFQHFIKENYFYIIPILITVGLYLISLFFGFRNFDEDIIIKNFYEKRTFLECIEKYLLTSINGVTQASGFTFSGVKNVHWSPLERPVFFLTSYLFQAKPFLFHLLSLILHCINIYLFSRFCFYISRNKSISLFSSLMWGVLPTNAESIIWATNWPWLIGSVIYLITLNNVAHFFSKKNNPDTNFIIKITLLVTLQMLFHENTITIPVAIFFVVLLQGYLSNKTFDYKKSFKTSLFPFLVLIAYLAIRFSFVDKISSPGNISETIERILFLCPQVFFHQLKIIFLPIKLSIDQLDLITLDPHIFGLYHFLCLFFSISFLLAIFIAVKNYPIFSLGLLLCLIALSPFIQIIPLYSMCAERYNYLASAFLIFALLSTLARIYENKKVFIIPILTLIVIIYGTRTMFRIFDWESSKTLFTSTIKTSKSLLKKGVWTYNLALSENNKSTKEQLLRTSINYLENFIARNKYYKTNNIFKQYEIDPNSLTAKAALRMSKIFDILNEKENWFSHLKLALKYCRKNSKMKGLIYNDIATYSFQKNNFQNAIKFYEKSYLITPSSSISYAIAVCYLKLKDLTNYEKYLRRAVSAISLENTKPFKTYGQFLELEKNDLYNAARYYKIASLLEDNPEPYILLSTALIKLNMPDKAFSSINNGLYAFSNSPSLLFLRGAIYISKNKINQGKNDLLKVVNNKTSPDDIKIEATKILSSLQ